MLVLLMLHNGVVPIPMRGNELENHTKGDPNSGVSDPHEG